MRPRIITLSFIVMSLCIILGIVLFFLFSTILSIQTNWSGLISFVIAIVFSKFLFWFVEKNKFLLRLYWGPLYLDGLWSYTYTLVGSDPENPSGNKSYFGIWRFTQTLLTTKVNGFGLTEDFEPRSHVESLSQLFENNGHVEIFNRRTDSVDPERTFFSKTSMDLDLRTNSIFEYPKTFVSRTIIFGGVLTGNLHEDIFFKHEHALTEADVISEIKNKINLNQN